MEFAVHRCPAGFVRETVERDHYLGRWPDPRSIPFAYCPSVDGKRTAPDGRPFGVVVMKKLQHHRQRGLFGNQYVVKISRRFNHRDRWRELGEKLASLGNDRPVRFNQSLRDENGFWLLPTGWQAVDVCRVWVHPALQAPSWAGTNRKGEPAVHTANVFSRMLSAVVRRVQLDWLEHHPPVFPELPYHIELIISYCDLGHHDGTGYRASNFQKWGLTSDGTKEIYFRRLKAPRFKYEPVPEAQQSLFEAA